MTEAEWLACTDPAPMLEFLYRNASERKVRLFFCACCRAKRYIACPKGLEAVAVAEAFGDGLADESVRADTDLIIQSLIPDDGNWSAYSLIAWALHKPIGESYRLDYVMQWAIPCVIEAGLASGDEVLSIIRDIFANPFRPTAIDSRWLTATVSDLALTIYREKAFERLPILADALQDAGCDSEEIIAHCRSDGPHARGCWVVDKVLGKE